MKIKCTKLNDWANCKNIVLKITVDYLRFAYEKDIYFISWVKIFCKSERQKGEASFPRIITWP